LKPSISSPPLQVPAIFPEKHENAKRAKAGEYEVTDNSQWLPSEHAYSSSLVPRNNVECYPIPEQPYCENECQGIPKIRQVAEQEISENRQWEIY